MNDTRCSITNLLLLLIILVFFPQRVLCSNSNVAQNRFDQPCEDYLVLKYHNTTSALEAGKTLAELQAGNATFNQTCGIKISGSASLVNLTQLEEALTAQNDQIRELHYQIHAPIAGSTLRTLEQSPQAVRLYYQWPSFSWHRNHGDAPTWLAGQIPLLGRRELTQPVLRSTALYSLGVDLEYGSEDNNEDMRRVHQALTASPNVRELKVSLSHWGCILADYAWAFDFATNNDSLPPLEMVSLSGYELGSTVNGGYDGLRWNWNNNPKALLAPWSWLPQWLLDLLPPLDFDRAMNYTALEEVRSVEESKYRARREREGPPNLNAWIERMDWSGVKHLHLGEPTSLMLRTLTPHLERLQHLSLGSGNHEVATNLLSFLDRLKRPLEHLELHNVDFDDYSDIVASISRNSGESLTALILAENEANRHRWCTSDFSEELCDAWNGVYYLPRPFLNASQLNDLAVHNPGLSLLELDVTRLVPLINDSSTWTYDVSAVRAAALQPNLSGLVINVESPDFTLVRAGRLSESRYSSRLENPLPRFSRDPSFNRTSVPVLFRNINQSRENQGLKRLKRLEIKIGRWDSRFAEWGMMDPPDLLVGQWLCETDGLEDGKGECSGEFQSLGYGTLPPYDDKVGEEVILDGWDESGQVFTSYVHGRDQRILDFLEDLE